MKQVRHTRGAGRAGVVAALLGAAPFPLNAEHKVPESPAESLGREHRETDRTILEFPSGDLSPAEAEAFGRLLDRGVADIEALVAPALADGDRRSGRIRFIVSAGVPIARCHGRTVLLPLERVRSRSAPYLHETVHALVPARGESTWLSEGLACHLESWVSENRGGYDAHVFTRAGDRGIHAAARRLLETGPGRAVLPWVGAPGEPPFLDEDRAGVARPFYVLSQSLAKHVVDSAGLGPVVRALASAHKDALRGATGRSSEAWKREWLEAIGAPTTSRPVTPSVSGQ
jgi:hypothetical protein